MLGVYTKWTVLCFGPFRAMHAAGSAPTARAALLGSVTSRFTGNNSCKKTVSRTVLSALRRVGAFGMGNAQKASSSEGSTGKESESFAQSTLED
eukprot:5086621-Amphidinium_carterae.1